MAFFQPHGKIRYYDVPDHSKCTNSKERIPYRSWWEGEYMKNLDANPNIISWKYEPFMIPYSDPVQKKERKYKPDFLIELSGGGTIIVEMKPYNHIFPEILNENEMNDREREHYNKMLDGAITNRAKFVFADTWCRDQGYIFVVMTEQGFIRHFSETNNH